MFSHQSAERQYTEKEVSAIIQRASALQAVRPAGEGDRGVSGGTTLAQLQQAAAELGIDPDLIERAAADFATEETVGQGSRLLGGPWRVDCDRLVNGAVTEDSWPLLLDEMRAATGRVGYPKTVGKGFECLSLQPDPLHVTVTPQGKKTRLRVTARFGQWGALLYLAPGLLAFLLAVMLTLALGKSSLMSPELIVCLLMGLPAATLLGGRVAFGRLCAQKHRRTRSLIARLERAITQPSQEVVEAVPARHVTTTTPDDEPVLAVQRNNNLG